MGVDLSENDNRVLDRFLNHVLDRYKNGVIDRMSVRLELAEAVALIANDNGNVVLYMKAILQRKGEED